MSTPTNNKRKILDKVSSYSFLLGLVASKIQYLPITLATPFLNLISLCLYLSGYSLWFVASHFYPDHYPKFTEWYGFAQFKEQNSYAAFLGIAAALVSIAAIALPILAIPAVWMFFASNVLWTVGEYHKLKNPPPDENYSESYQKSYLSYALAMTAMGLVGALAATAIFFFPLLTIPALAISGLMSIALGVVAVEYWLDYTFGDHKKTPVSAASYNKMTNGLGPSIELEEIASPAPYHNQKLLEKTKPSHEHEIESTEIDSPTCNMPW